MKKMENLNKEFAERLENLIEDVFGGNKSAFIRSIGMEHRQQINDYIGGKSILGGKYLAKLAEQNIDINKLLTGKSYINEAILERLDGIEKKFEERITNLEAENYRYIKLVEEKENKIAELEGQLLVRFALAGELEKKLKK
ncbi:MAG: hypothetical protein HYS24_01885 [Ignavibacteriales bacterium]|nr:hypothetical protein [Ignavibacteriales bacterium]